MTNSPACQVLLGKLDRNETVSNTALERALGDEHWADYQNQVTFEKDQREQAKQIVSKLSSYSKMLRTADLQHSRNEKHKNKRRNAALPPKKNVDAYYQLALERLSELLGADPALQVHLDRDFDYGKKGGIVSPDYDGVPRFKTSGKAYGKAHNQDFPSASDCKRSALEAAISSPSTQTQVNLGSAKPVPAVMPPHLKDKLAMLQKLIRR